MADKEFSELESSAEEEVMEETIEEASAENAGMKEGEPADSQERPGDSETDDGKEEAAQEDPAGEEETAQEDPAGEEPVSEEAEEAKTEEGSGKKKKRFLNQSKKDKRDQKIEELNDRLLRNMAEFENFRNRSEKEKSAMFEIGAKSIVEKILPVVDNFERGLDAVTDEDRENAFVKGMEAVYKQFSTVLEEIGVVPIEAVGKEFDPNLHNAVMHDEDDSMEANIISEEFQKGYMYKDSVVRHSMVKVVN